MICEVADCENEVRCHKWNLCNRHHLRFLRHGNPTGGGTDYGARTKFLDILKNYTGSDCVTWPFGLNPKGYGTMSYKGKQTSAQRAVAFHCYGDPGEGIWEAAHSCGNGNKGCCNPKHIRWATREENHADRILHGTSNRGERNGQAKLTGEQVLDIFMSNASTKELAKKYNVCYEAARDIRNGKRWKSVTEGFRR